ncbi:MAG: SOS response-associated peptidase [Chromatiaceae bacterium]|nr:MAG: SOS response-associated peptidase [Chromatiaceae bacterium]
MCGRFVQHAEPSAYASRYAASDRSAPVDGGTAARGSTGGLTGAGGYNVAPTQRVLALRTGADGSRELVRLRWGLVPAWSRGPDPRYSMINARAENVHERPAWRGPWRGRRCLIPAEGFYEWRRTAQGRQPHLIHRADGAPFCMAGLWDRWQDPAGDVVIESCSILVTGANDLIAPLHDRMPVILAVGQYADWLDPACQEHTRRRGWLVPAASAGWVSHPVSPAVNNPRNDGPHLLQPLSAATDA